VLKAKKLKHRYLVFEVSHSVLLVDASSVGGSNEILPAEGKAQTLSSLHFRSWQWAERHLTESGASRDDLDKTRDSLMKTSVALLQIWSD
jgi:hypothetical protein